MQYSLFRAAATLILGMMSVLACSAWADFAPTQGTTGRFIRVLATSGSAIYAGTDRGVYRSTDTGTTWAVSGAGGPSVQVMSMAVSGNTVVAGYLDSGVAVSEDGGLTWKTSRQGFIDPDVYSVGIRGTQILAGTIDGLFSSADGGANWEPAWMGGAFAAIVTRGTEAFAMEAGGELRYSSAPGQNFIVRNADISGGAFSSANFFSMASEGDAFFAGSDRGVWRSPDKGVTWQAVGASSQVKIPASAYVVALAVAEGFLLAGTNSYGVYLSGNRGDAWVYAGQGLPLGYCRGLLVLGGKVLVGTGNNGVYRRDLADLPSSIRPAPHGAMARSAAQGPALSSGRYGPGSAFEIVIHPAGSGDPSAVNVQGRSIFSSGTR
jgi:hypothetical protein